MAGKGDSRRPTMVSQEELNLRDDYARGVLKISLLALKKRIYKIRERTGKP